MNSKNRLPLFAACLFLGLALLLSSCSQEPAEDLALNTELFARALAAPSQSIQAEQINPAAALLRFQTVEAFDWQVEKLLEHKPDLIWQPHFLATIVLVTDKGQTDLVAASFADLAEAGLPVSIAGEQASFRSIITGVSYILDGDFSLQGAVRLFGGLQEKGLLASSGSPTPYRIMFDYEAASLIKAGEDLVMMIPHEGSLTLTKGLVSRAANNLPPLGQSAYLEAGLRLPDGRSDMDLYPAAASYQRAVSLASYTGFARASQNVWRVYRRKIQLSRRFSTVDMREHMLSALFFIALVIAWAGYMARRVLGRSSRVMILLTALSLVSWTVLRVFKYELPARHDLTRYLWYSYYIFQLGLPLLLARLASLLDREESAAPARWWQLAAILNGILLLLVFSNDLHGWIFRLELAGGWDGSYSYGSGYYFLLVCNVGVLLAAIGLLLHKARQNPRKKTLVFPLIFTFLLLLYAVLYVLRFPLAWESDFTITIGIFALLFLQSAMYSGLIPVNAKHSLLFSLSPLAMEILDEQGRTVFASANPPGEKSTTVRFARIPGGTTFWYEDLQAERQLQESLNKTNQELAWGNEILSHEHRIKSELAEIKAREKLQVELHEQIGSQLLLVSDLYSQAEEEKLPVVIALSRINLLLTYVKRRYNLIFWSRQSSTIGSTELVAYMAELGDMSAAAGVVLALLPELDQKLALDEAICCYSFLFEGLWQAINRNQTELIARFSTNKDMIALQLLADQPFSNDFKTTDPAGGQIDLHSEGYLHQARLRLPVKASVDRTSV